MKKTFFILFAFSASLFSVEIDDLDTLIEKTRNEWNVPGVSIVVVKDGQVIFKKGYGVSDIDTNSPIDENTIFQLASVTKTFTAAALGVLVDQDQLSWDENIVNYLPEFALKDPYPTRYTTTRDLLAHRTSLPAFGGDLLGKLGFSDSEILRRVRYIEPSGSFREKGQYSNMGYFIAGEVLARVSKKTWQEAVKTTLIAPLNMQRTGFAQLLDTSNVAKGHVLNGKTLKVVNWDKTGGFPAAGAMTSTANDMGKWMQMLLNQGKPILKQETIQEMFSSSMVAEVSFSEVEPINEYSGFDFGMGWGNYHYKGKMIVEKGGGLDGIRTLVTLVPEMKLGITILTNLNLTLYPEFIRAKFLELFLGNSGIDLESIIMKKGQELQKMVAPKQIPTAQIPPCRPLKDFTGTFENQLYGQFVVTENSGQLAIIAGPGSFKGTLTHMGLNTFNLTWPVVNTGNDAVHFIFNQDGKAIAFEVEGLGRFEAL